MATEIGGIFNSFYLLGLAFTLAFSYNLMMSSLIRQLYHFNARFPSEIKKDKKKKGKGKKKGESGKGDGSGPDGGSEPENPNNYLGDESDDDEQLRDLKKAYAAEEAEQKSGKT